MSEPSAPTTFATAYFTFSLWLSTSAMANTSSTPSFAESPLVLSAFPSVPPSVTTISPAMPTASNRTPTVPPLVSSSTVTSVGEGNPLLPSTTSVTPNTSPQSIFSSSMDAAATGTDLNALTNLSSAASQYSSQYSSYPETSTFPTQTGTTNEQVQTGFSAPVSVTTSTSINVSEPLPTSIGASTQPGSALATNTQVGTTSSSNSFFNNRGTVIGLFVAIAIFSTAIIACLCVAWRCRRTRDRMLRAIGLPRDDANRGPHDQPTMNIISAVKRNDTLSHGISAGAMLTANISVSTTGNTTDGTGFHYDGPFSDYFAVDRTSRCLTGLAVTANSRIDPPVPSLAPPISSIFPPSLPPMDTKNNMTRSVVCSARLSTPSIHLPQNPSRDLTGATVMLSVSLGTVVPPSSSSPDNPLPPSSVKDAKHKSSGFSGL